MSLTVICVSRVRKLHPRNSQNTHSNSNGKLNTWVFCKICTYVREHNAFLGFCQLIPQGKFHSWSSFQNSYELVPWHWISKRFTGWISNYRGCKVSLGPTVVHWLRPADCSTPWPPMAQKSNITQTCPRDLGLSV